MAEAVLAFGSNLGDSAAAILGAMKALDGAHGVALVRASRLYRTPPWGLEDQPDFINACAMFETSLSPEALLSACKELEQEMGRTASERWGPRLIDIDLIWMAGEVRASETLTLPHPRAAERAFVLVPLEEIAPFLEIGGVQVRKLVSGLGEETGRITRL